MDAAVTLKTTVTELDVIRRALDSHAVHQTVVINAPGPTTPKEIREARAELLRTQDLAGKIR